MANPNTVEEEYVEVRWVSPDDQRLRWSVGASYYHYDYNQLNFNQYNAILNPELQLDPLVGEIFPTRVTNQEGENTGVFFNLTYDITDRNNFSFEGRYESDDVTDANVLAEDALAAATATVRSITSNTESFLPRIALTTAISEDVSVYAQIAVGNNPGGVNPEWLNPLTIEAIRLVNQEIADGTISLANSIPGTTQEEFDNYPVFL